MVVQSLMRLPKAAFCEVQHRLQCKCCPLQTSIQCLKTRINLLKPCCHRLCNHTKLSSNFIMHLVNFLSFSMRVFITFDMASFLLQLLYTSTPFDIKPPTAPIAENIVAAATLFFWICLLRYFREYHTIPLGATIVLGPLDICTIRLGKKAGICCSTA